MHSLTTTIKTIFLQYLFICKLLKKVLYCQNTKTTIYSENVYRYAQAMIGSKILETVKNCCLLYCFDHRKDLFGFSNFFHIDGRGLIING